MILIDEILVADDVLKQNFVCNLNACHGACCIEGDYGAPLEKDEVETINEILDKVMPYLPEKSKNKIAQDGFFTISNETQTHETALMENGACVFMDTSDIGIHYCTIEKAFNDGKVAFKKPISCHLYPIRILKNRLTGFEAINYDKWDICNPACVNGDKLKIRVFEFAKDALIRKYGEEFYEDLKAAAQHMDQS